MATAACGSAAGKTMATSGSLRVLQMNLCNSGFAPCYTGRSVAQAAADIRAERPDIVTVNEVCRDDVSVLKRALSGAEPGSVVASAFRPALQEHSDNPFRCRNGQQYGIGVLVSVRPPSPGFATSGGHYSVQDPADTERRVWVCMHARAAFYACTTHLSSTSRAVAMDQCRYFMNKVIPAVRMRRQTDPVVLGGDFNLPNTQAPNPQSCIPPGFVRTDDGARQDVIASVPLRVASTNVIDMQGTTDHPALVADLALSRRPFTP